ncbi:MAG: hypothetical protein GX660_28705 [Clostridiaceae bacterium]|nr:hypothetical protein [Clostridiaceae bacterium]
MNRTVYFLGAGATINAAPEAPTNKNLVKNALTDFIQSNDAQTLLGFIADLFRRADPVIDNQIWNLLDYLIQQGKSPSPKYNLEQIVDLRKHLLHLIIQEFQRSLEIVEPRIHEMFVEKIKDSDSSVISTNYDILIDSALSKTIGLNYGAKARTCITEGYEDIAGFKRAELFDAGIQLNKGRIELLKIHGSLNWLYCSKCDEVDITIDKGAVRTVTGDYYCFNKHCTNKYTSLLITPTMFKNYENRFIKETWECAEKALINADRLVFIGYALKDEDYQIRCLLMKALLNKIKTYSDIVVIERKPKNKTDEKYLTENIKRKYEDLYGRIDFRPIGFTGYIDSM